MISFASRLYAYTAATVFGWYMSGLQRLAEFGTRTDDAYDVFPEEGDQ